MYASLGNVQFQLLPLTDLDQKSSFEYAEHKVIEGKPLLQFLGENLDELNIGLRFHFTFCDPDTEYEKLKAEAALHQALPFMFNNGKYLGRFVVCDITKTYMATADNGRPLDIQARVTLKEWSGKAPLTDLQVAQVKKALAISGQTAVAAVGAVPPAKAAEVAAANQRAMVAGGVKASAMMIGLAARGLALVAGGLGAIMGAAAPAIGQLTALASAIGEQVGPILGQVQNIAQGVQGAASMVQGYVANIASLSSGVTRILSGLPGPAGKLGRRMAVLNKKISGEATKMITLTSLVQGGAIEAGTRAQMITRMLPK